MIKNRIYPSTILLIFATVGIFAFANSSYKNDSRFITYIVNPKKQAVRLYWKNDNQEILKSIQHLKSWLDQKHQKLLFAMNAGMYKQDNSPQGLYVENKIILAALDTASGNGNFYLKPNGVFYITTDNIANICKTTAYLNNSKIKYATQSGPMLLIDGEIHPAFKQGSTNLNIRNGLGILPGNKIIFAMSKEEINFYDFAIYFKNMGCKNALYLDGLVSRTYLPEQNWTQTDGNFGVMIAVTENAN